MRSRRLRRLRCWIVVVVVFVVVVVVAFLVAVVVECRSGARVRSRRLSVCHGLRHEAGGVRQTDGVKEAGVSTVGWAG